MSKSEEPRSNGVSMSGPEFTTKATLHRDQVNGQDNDEETSQTGLPRIWFHSTPRTASNMFVHIMSKHPGLAYFEYEVLFSAVFPFADQFDKDPLAETPEEEKQRCISLNQNAFEAIVTKVQDAEKRKKRVFWKEHTYITADRRKAYEFGWRLRQENSKVDEKEWNDDRWVMKMPGEIKARTHTNPTMYPDDWVLSFLPIFLIRHPAKTIVSGVRCMKTVFPQMGDGETPSTLTVYGHSWTRRLYDWYKETGVASAKQLPNKDMQEAWPVVIDADDVMKNQKILARLCQLAGLDPSDLQYEWSVKSESELKDISDLGKFMTRSLITSTGVNAAHYAGEVDLDAEQKKWVEEFGQEKATFIRGLVDEDMVDYQYLRARKLGAQ